MHITLCDDHPLFMDGLVSLLQVTSPDLRARRYRTAREMLHAAPDWVDVDLLLLDLLLPDAEGLQTLHDIRELRDDVPVVIVSSLSDRDIVGRALEAGAAGYVPKSSSAEAMIAALKTVLMGGIYLPDGFDVASATRGMPPADGNLCLTPRQWEILHRVLQGKSIKRIANELEIAESTVKTHITPILRALGATTRTEAIVRAHALGIRLKDGPV